MDTGKIITGDNCVGCNLCIAACPCDEANVAILEDGENRVYVDGSKCIACGACLQSCTHNSRDYIDDTERFFADLKAGKKISLIAAPALRCNVPEWSSLLGYLKSAGVATVFDASYGADICTWSYLRYITENNESETGLISQPCPAIVNYIEKYVPELLSRLAPIHSPAMCTAVYMKKYKGMTESIAFLSPCVAKSYEISDPNTEGLIEYNVTFKKLLEYLQENGVDYRKSSATEYDNEEHGLGCVYSSPGGLKVNVERHMPGRWIYQVEGQPHVCEFLHEYVNERADAPFLVDILSCEKGCNIGSGTCRAEGDEAYAASKAMFRVPVADGPDFSDFDEKLDLSDFVRGYTPKKIIPVFVDRHELETAFIAMQKPTSELRLKDCRACGYTTCQKMAVAVAKGVNHVDNCVDYSRAVLKQQRQAAKE